MKRMLLVVTAILTIIGINVGTAFAWTYSLQGSGKCQPDGSFKITWTVTNPETEALQITNSSNPSVVPVGTEVPPGSPPPSKQDFIQTADGAKAASFSLSLTGHFKSDETNRTMSHKVDLTDPCTQPTPPTPPTTPSTSSQGSGTPVVLGATTTVVSAPVGPVSAGSGGAAVQFRLVNFVGVATSLLVLTLGLITLKTNKFDRV